MSYRPRPLTYSLRRDEGEYVVFCFPSRRTDMNKGR
jgi:hypothetical protein